MATKQPNDLILDSLKGGMNDQDPETLLPDDECVLAQNVEFFNAGIGERRNGCSPVNLTGAGLSGQAILVHLSQRFPTNDPLVGEIWAITATPTVSTAIAFRNAARVWMPVTPIDSIGVAEPQIYQIVAQSYQDKQFFAYKRDLSWASNVAPPDGRLYVWDGTSFRRAGLAQPAAAPTAVDEGSGSYASKRYFRIRYIRKDATGKILLRSEPSASVSLTPSGSGAGATVTRPALIGEAETDWELEASADDSTYYRIGTVAIATTTQTDTVVTPLSYPDNGVLSEPIGSYLLQPSCQFLLVDGDRLIMAGHWYDPAQQSTVYWTPVSKDSGVGNDERLPLNSLIDDRVSLDNYEGGNITGLSQTTFGSFYVFKWSHIYQATRTGVATSAYTFDTISKVRGALPGSVVSGIDEYGNACVYFLDPLMGPSRIGPSGLQLIHGLRNTFNRVNRVASKVVCHGIYYPEKRQVHWWIAADGNQSPTLIMVLQVNETSERSQYGVVQGEVTRGWSIWNGRIAQAYCSTIVNMPVRGTGGITVSLSRRPYIGLTSPDYLQQTDVTSTDAGVPYIAKIRTKPYLMAGLLNKWGAMTAAILHAPSTNNNMRVSIIRDFGAAATDNPTYIDTNLEPTSPTSTETLTRKKFDSLVMSEAYALQFEFSDVPPI